MVCDRLVPPGVADAGAAGAAPPQSLPPALRESDEPFTLTRLEQLADQYHPLLPRDRAQVDAALGHATQAGLWPNPRFYDANPQTFAGRYYVQYVGFSQEIPVMGKKRLERAAANEVARQTEFNYFQDRYGLFTNIRMQFYQVLSDQRRIQVLNETGPCAPAVPTRRARKNYRPASPRPPMCCFSTSICSGRRPTCSAPAPCWKPTANSWARIVGIPGLVDRDVSGELSGDYPVFDEEGLKRYVTTQNTQSASPRPSSRRPASSCAAPRSSRSPTPISDPLTSMVSLPGAEQFWLNIQFDIPVWNRNQGGIREARGNLQAAEENLMTIQLRSAQSRTRSVWPISGGPRRWSASTRKRSCPMHANCCGWPSRALARV